MVRELDDQVTCLELQARELEVAVVVNVAESKGAIVAVVC